MLRQTARNYSQGSAAKGVKRPWKETSKLVLRRGPYLISAGLDESAPDAKPYTLHGRCLNLLEPSWSCITTSVSPGSRMLLFDLNSVKSLRPEGGSSRLQGAERAYRWQISALHHQLLKIPKAEPKSQIPANAQHDDLGFKCRPLGNVGRSRFMQRQVYQRA
jgi:hypothetical protein